MHGFLRRRIRCNIIRVEETEADRRNRGVRGWCRGGQLGDGNLDILGANFVGAAVGGKGGNGAEVGEKGGHGFVAREQCEVADTKLVEGLRVMIEGFARNL